MILWTLAATIAGLLIGAALSKGLLKLAASRVRWTAFKPSELGAGAVSAVLVLSGVGVMFLIFGVVGGGAAALLAAIGGVAWSLTQEAKALPPWLRVAQGATVGIVAVPLGLGLGLSIASLGGPLSGNPDTWRDLVGDRAYPAWVACVRSGNKDYRSSAISHIRRAGQKARPILFEALNNDVDPVRASAVEGLGLLGGPGVYEVVAPLLNDPNGEVSKNAVTALTKLGDTRAIRLFLEAAAKAPESFGGNDYTRGIKGLPGGLEFARQCAMGEGDCAQNADLRYAAVTSLDRFSQMEKADAEPLLRGLRDTSPRVREAALGVCANLLRQWKSSDSDFFTRLIGGDAISSSRFTKLEINPDELIVAATKLLEDPDDGVRGAAGSRVPYMFDHEKGINGIEAPRSGDPDGRYPKMPIARVTPILLRVLNGSNRADAGEAAQALAFLGDRRAIPVLKELDAKENYAYNCSWCSSLEQLGVGPLAHSTTYPSNLR